MTASRPHPARHERPALRERRRRTSGTWSSTSRPTSGCASSAARPRLPLRLRERHARHADHAQGAPGRHHARGADRARRRRAGARLRRLRHRLRQLLHDALATRTASSPSEIYRALVDGGTHPARDRSARPTTSRRGMFLPDRYVRGTCPQLRRRSTSTATAARSAAPRTRPPT